MQIYCDFSAYTDIAIGVAALLGYRFPRNFDQPYRAAVAAGLLAALAHLAVELAARLSLHPARRQPRRAGCSTYRNLMLTMLLGGLWHGAAWKFVIWGALHGGGLAIERCARAMPRAPPNLEVAMGAGARDCGRLPLRLLLLDLLPRQGHGAGGEVIAGLADWSQPAQLVTPFMLVLLAIGMAVQFTPRDLLQRLERRAFNREHIQRL